MISQKTEIYQNSPAAPFRQAKKKSLVLESNQCFGSTLVFTRRDFGIGLLKSYHTFVYLTCSVRSKKNFHTPPYCAMCTSPPCVLIVSYTLTNCTQHLGRYSTYTQRWLVVPFHSGGRACPGPG